MTDAAKTTWWQEFLPHRIDDFREWLGPHDLPSRKLVRELVAKIHFFDGADAVKLLDCGCGLCIDCDGYAADGTLPYIDYTGLDSCEHLVNVAKDHGVDAVLGDVTSLPFPDNSYDAVCIREVLEHLPSIEAMRAAVSEAIRVSRSRVFITFFLPPDSDRQMEYLAAENVHHNRWSRTDIALAVVSPKVAGTQWHDADDGRKILELRIA